MKPRDRNKTDYSHFNYDSETDPTLIQPYTDALADESIDHLLESMPETLHTVKVSFDGTTEYGINGSLVDASGDADAEPVHTPIDFHVEGTFGIDTVELIFTRLRNGIRHQLKVTKSGEGEGYFAEADDTLIALDDDDLVALSVRAAGLNPTAVQLDALTKTVVEHDSGRLVRPSFPLTLAVFWSELGLANGGEVTASKQLEVELPGSTTDRPIVGRLTQEETEKLRETVLTLTLADVKKFPDLDAEQVTQLVLEYTWQTDNSQSTQLNRYVISDLQKASTRLVISRHIPDEKLQKLDARDPKYLQQFQNLLRYMMNVST